MGDEEIPDVLDFDTYSASPEAFGRRLFDPPAVRSKREEDPWFGEPVELVRLCTRLFERFGELSAPYPVKEIDRGLWRIHGNPYFLKGGLAGKSVPVDDAVACVRASYHLYADFASIRSPDDQLSSLYMWWDVGWLETPPFLAAWIETLERILALPDLTSRRAALHGLAHFKQEWDEQAGKAAIDRFINRERANLSEDLLAYAEFCRDQFHV